MSGILNAKMSRIDHYDKHIESLPERLNPLLNPTTRNYRISGSLTVEAFGMQTLKRTAKREKSSILDISSSNTCQS